MKDIKPKYRKRLIKILIITAIILAVGTFGVHLWFKHNARKVLKKYITEQSGGKIKLELSELDLNLFKNRLQIHEADLVSTDSLHQPITYHVGFRKLTLQVASVWALLFKNQLLLDSIKLHDPVIEVMLWRKDTSQARAKDELSIPQEMGKVYRSMYDALDEFGIKRIMVNNARITLINKMKQGSDPVTVSRIYFDLARLYPRAKNKQALLKDEQSLELRTTNQDIAMPGGRHRLSFKSFKLQLWRQRIELDSCTVTAIATDTTKSSYRIFFKKLFLSGVDFSAMSSQNVIKADSVYCENPDFNFDIYKSNTAKKKTEIPDVQKIIRELSGNLDLAFVGIKNAGIHIDVHGRTKRSFFNSNKDNFEMRGFRINPDSSEPVAVKHFEMTLRDYHLYNEDSTSVFAFDSLLLLNSKIALNNFSINSRSSPSKVRNEINISVPYFQLTNLDWYQLIFDQKLSATGAVLNNPDIYFKRNIPAKRGKKVNLFTALENIDSLVGLNNVSVTNGQVNLQLGRGTSFKVEDLNFGVHSNKLLGSTNRVGLRSAIEHLSFSRGVLQLKDITARLLNARYAGNNQVYTDKISLSSRNNIVTGNINNVHINNLLFDDAQETIEMDGFEWTSASLAVKLLPVANNKNNKNRIHFRNIAGKNTLLTFSKEPMVISTFVQSLHVASLLKDETDPLRLEGFNMTGNDLLLKNNTLNISANAYGINSNQPSYLRGIQVQQVKGRDTLNIQSPEIIFAADINSLLDNNLHLTNLQATSPVVKFNKWDTSGTAVAVKEKPPILIDRFTTTEPDIYIATHRYDSVTIIHIPHSENSILNATGINISSAGIQLGSLNVNTTSATFTKKTGEKTGIEKGKIDVDVSNVFFGEKDGKNTWNAFINKFEVTDESGLRFGKNQNNLSFNKASFGNLNLSSTYLPDFSKLIKVNLSAWLHIPAGKYVDSNTTLQWHNAQYNNSNRTLSLDSFNYHPTLPLDSFLKIAPYQTDYITVRSGAISINGLDAEQYDKDSSLIADAVTITNPVMTVYRDKLPPNSPHKKDKALPVGMIKNIALPVAVKSVQVENGTITYSEKNSKSRKEGTLSLTNLNGSLENIKNRNLADNDSLSLSLNGYLMDSAQVDISLKESYTDSLNSFLLNVRIKPTPLSILNPLLVPLSNVKIASGTLDSLTLQAIGRNDIALGEMKMHYHDLRIKLVKDGDPDKSTFFQNVVSFLANTFLIKRNNTSRTGVVYYDRQSTQSFTKYIVKMTLSGVTSSVGVKKNRKYMKEYQKELEKSGMPPLK